MATATLESVRPPHHASPVAMDEIDRKILALLRADARRTVRDIAMRVNLTVAPVKRRIERLEATGVIDGYTVRINQMRAGSGLEAVTEMRFVGDLDLQQIVQFASAIPQIQEILTVAGDPDAIVRLRVDSVDQLHRVIDRIRTGGGRVTGTRTLVILDSWTRS